MRKAIREILAIDSSEIRVHGGLFGLPLWRQKKSAGPKAAAKLHVLDSTLGLSFIRISGFVFDTGSLVVKPSEEQLKKKLENVKSLHLSIYSIISIEELSEKV